MSEELKSVSLDLLAECSWEVCNKIGGIYTVLSTKAAELKKLYGDRLVFIGPDHGQGVNSVFKERKSLLGNFSNRKLPHGIKVRVGRWDIPGSPLVVLVDFRPVFPMLNSIYGEMWEKFGVDSLHAYGDYDESCAFAIASAIVIAELSSALKADASKTIGHFNEWTTGMGLLYLKLLMPEAATVFTTHATTIGRSICGNGKALYQYFEAYNGDQMARELNVEAKHSLEKAAAWNADCFTTVSDVTARECGQLLDKWPDVVTPNGFEPSFLPEGAKWEKLRRQGRSKITKIAGYLGFHGVDDRAFIVATSGRNEFRNKGLDLYIDSMTRLAEKLDKQDRRVIALVLVPAWVKQPNGDLLIDMDFGGWIKPEPDFLTHRLNNEDSDSIACHIRHRKGEIEAKGLDGKLKFVFVPSYLDGDDGIVNISYYDLLPAVDLSIFCSYYEPWGYTPLESVAFGVPTVTTDKAGFGEWYNAEVKDSKKNKDKAKGVTVIPRCDRNYDECVEVISDTALNYMRLDPKERGEAMADATAVSRLAEWSLFISKYLQAFKIALDKKLR